MPAEHRFRPDRRSAAEVGRRSASRPPSADGWPTGPATTSCEVSSSTSGDTDFWIDERSTRTRHLSEGNKAFGADRSRFFRHL